ncbi:hypothetical protein IH785_05680 [candidate division KSB1 bacterium]|nr:hypothetical protein [candidate division KSB1 bacterium]
MLNQRIKFRHHIDVILVDPVPGKVGQPDAWNPGRFGDVECQRWNIGND